jgi:uncharacterized membrane protein
MGPKRRWVSSTPRERALAPPRPEDMPTPYELPLQNQIFASSPVCVYVWFRRRRSMSQAETPNPERRSDSAILCLCIGLALVAASWFMGLGGVLATLFSGNAAAMAGGMASLLLLPLVAACGVVMFVVGAVWVLVRVIIDRREDHAKERYSREVER